MVVLCSLLSSPLRLSKRILDIFGSGPLLVDAFTAADIICGVSMRCSHFCAIDGWYWSSCRNLWLALWDRVRVQVRLSSGWASASNLLLFPDDILADLWSLPEPPSSTSGLPNPRAADRYQSMRRLVLGRTERINDDTDHAAATVPHNASPAGQEIGCDDKIKHPGNNQNKRSRI